ncbi:RpiR family transcriptional regulator, partial [Micromonospora azadirachtae]
MVDHEVDTSAGTAVVDADAFNRRGVRAAASEGVLARVRSGLDELTGALRRVAEHVLSDPE